MTPEERENLRSKDRVNPITREKRFIFSLLPTRGKFIDIGCGYGNWICNYCGRSHRAFWHLNLDITGVDFSRVTVNKCLKDGQNVIQMDVDKGLKFEDNSFDGAIMLESLEHFFDPIFVLKETHRILKPGGQLFITVPNNFTLRKRLRAFIKGDIQLYFYKILGQCKHHTIVSWELMEYMLKDFKIEPYFFVGNWITQNRFLGRMFTRMFMIKAQARCLEKH